jgi:hypothetical protein
MTICRVSLNLVPLNKCIDGTYPTVPDAENRCNLPSKAMYIISWDNSWVQLLAILILCIIVRIKYDSKATPNKLTLLPYYFLLGYCFFTFLQFSWSSYCGFSFDLLGIINLNKQLCLNCAIAIQIFEFKNLY